MFEIKKDYKLNELLKIFEENNQGFVYDKNSITSQEFIRYVCVENNEPLGYLVLYPKSDFAIYDDYKISVTIPINSIYIWHIITKKNQEGKGVAKALINHIRKQYKNCHVYSMLDERNIKSIKLHESLGFKPVDKFKKAYKDTLDTYILVKCDAVIENEEP